MEERGKAGWILDPIEAAFFARSVAVGLSGSFSSVTDPQALLKLTLDAAVRKDTCFQYKESLARGTAHARAERLISDLVVNGADVSEESAEKIYQRELKRVSRKFTHMRYHSFLMYFGVFKRLRWVETTDETERSSIQDNFQDGPQWVYYHLPEKG